MWARPAIRAYPSKIPSFPSNLPTIYYKRRGGAVLDDHDLPGHYKLDPLRQPRQTRGCGVRIWPWHTVRACVHFACGCVPPLIRSRSKHSVEISHSWLRKHTSPHPHTYARKHTHRFMGLFDAIVLGDPLHEPCKWLRRRWARLCARFGSCFSMDKRRGDEAARNKTLASMRFLRPRVRRPSSHTAPGSETRDSKVGSSCCFVLTSAGASRHDSRSQVTSCRF